MTDLELLRAYEPVFHYTDGEMFFPTAVDGYLEYASLWKRAKSDETGSWSAVPVAESGKLTAETLPQYTVSGPTEILYLRFTQKPLNGIEYQRWRSQEKPPFHAPGRLARVGLISRISAALFSLSLLARGKVPGGTTAAAERQYRAIQERTPGRVYYGRVVREGGYTILHYHFFYCMNDWRSSFSGVNDHEADWEQILIYLADNDDGSYTPAWIAFAAHDYSGDDLRRRWDDPEITKEGAHPVVYAGAGSHAAYFQKGEYITQVDVSFLRPVREAAYTFRRVWRDVLRQGSADALVRAIEGLTRIPFVDYARGDGRTIGPGQVEEWTLVPIDDSVGWVDGYRGLWGLDTGDVLGGERAPAGPKYTREGTVRQSWYDPLGWSGLNKVPTPARAAGALEREIADLQRERADVDRQIATGRTDLSHLEMEIEALQATASLQRLRDTRIQELHTQERAVAALTRRRNEIDETLTACHAYLVRLQAGELGDPQAHVHHKHAPEPPSTAQQGRIAEFWAAASTGFFLLMGVILLATDVTVPIVAIGMVLATVLLVENILTGHLERLLLNVTIVLAVLASLVLIYQYFWHISLLAIAALAILLIVENFREVRGR